MHLVAVASIVEVVRHNTLISKKKSSSLEKFNRSIGRRGEREGTSTRAQEPHIFCMSPIKGVARIQSK